MRLIIYNPQKSLQLGKTVFDKLISSKWPAKYEYFKSYIKSGQCEIYCDNYGTSFPFKIFQKKVISFPLKFVEIYLWLIINRINPFKARIIFNKSRIRPDDCIFFFAYEYLQGLSQPSDGVLFLSCRKLVHLSHYFFRTSALARNLSEQKNVCLIAENNLKKNSPFYRKYFISNPHPFYVLPFAVKDRHRIMVPFRKRSNKCLAVGSFLTFEFHEYNQQMSEFYKTDTIHPLRKELWQNRDRISDMVECKLSYINDQLGQTSHKGNRTIYNHFVALKNLLNKRIFRNYGKSDYFKQDIVDLYNSFQMVIATQEAGELPAISFFEAMACGCACFAVPSDMYGDMGLYEKTHYIGFDGSLESLLAEIRHYQSNLDDLERIAANGHEYVVKHLREETVSRVFMEDLKNFEKAPGDPSGLVSSFVSK